jgi:hypothetical protein
MRHAFYAALFLLAVILRAAQPEPSIVVTLQWLNHVEMPCKGCSTQRIILEANSWAVVATNCDGKAVYVKVLPRWRGEAIEVSVATQERKSDGSFVEREAQTALVAEGQSKELTIEGFKYRVSASKAPEMKGELNQLPLQTPIPSVTDL